MISEAYHTVRHTHNGDQYQFRFYRGFVRRLQFLPPGATAPVELFLQGKDECFDTRPSGGLQPQCVLEISKNGGKDPFVVELSVDHSPIENHKGKIARVEVELQPTGAAHPGTQRVKANRGAERVKAIRVTEKNGGGSGGGGVHAMQSGGGTIIIDDDAETCPPDCT